jgi:hypothetical protein
MSLNWHLPTGSYSAHSSWVQWWVLRGWQHWACPAWLCWPTELTHPPAFKTAGNYIYNSFLMILELQEIIHEGFYTCVTLHSFQTVNHEKKTYVKLYIPVPVHLKTQISYFIQQSNHQAYQSCRWYKLQIVSK